MVELQKAAQGLPKNIRQVGERDSLVQLYVEDYVNIYLKRMTPADGQRIRAGLLLGQRMDRDGTCLLMDGALEIEGLTDGKGQVTFTEGVWKAAYREIEDHFPGRTVLGWFLCGDKNSCLTPLPYQKAHSQYFTEKNQLLFLNNDTEGQESWYVADREGFYKLRGCYIYYERNQMMQDYLVSLRDSTRVEAGGSDPVIRDFRRKMQERKNAVEKKQGKKGPQALKALCGLFFAAALAGCVVSLRSLEKMKVIETAVMSVVPEWKSEADILTVGRAILDARKGLTQKAEAGQSGKDGSSRTETAPMESHVLLEAPGSAFPIVNPAEDSAEGSSGENMDPEAVTASSGVDGTGKGLPTVEAFPEAGAGTGASIGAGTGTDTGAAGRAEGGLADSGAGSEPTAPVFRVLEPAPGQSVYIVREGQTLYGICFELYQNLSRVDEICRLNGITDVDRIEAGSRLIVP